MNASVHTRLWRGNLLFNDHLEYQGHGRAALRWISGKHCDDGRWMKLAHVQRRASVSAVVLVSTFRPAMGPTQTPIQWILGALTPGGKWPGA
jgi:hypothetical protein